MSAPLPHHRGNTDDDLANLGAELSRMLSAASVVAGFAFGSSLTRSASPRQI